MYLRLFIPDVHFPISARSWTGSSLELAQQRGAIPERARQIRLISLSFDPEHDTPEVLAKHAQAEGAVPPLWTFAVATHEELRQDRPASGALLWAQGERNRPQPLHGDHRSRRENSHAWNSATDRNKWENVDLLKTIYSLIPPARRAGKP